MEDAVSRDLCVTWIPFSVWQLHAEAHARPDSVAMKMPMNVFRITPRNVVGTVTADPEKNAPEESASQELYPNPNAAMTAIAPGQRCVNVASAYGSHSARVHRNAGVEKSARADAAFEMQSPNLRMSRKGVLFPEQSWRFRMLRRGSS